MGAYELRNGVLTEESGGDGGGGNLQTAMTVPMIFDYLAVRLDAAKAEGRRIVLNWTFTDTDERYVLNLEHAALTWLPSPPGVQPADADATITLSRVALDAVLLGQTAAQEAVASGAIAIDGDPLKLVELLGMLDTFGEPFNIVTP